MAGEAKRPAFYVQLEDGVRRVRPEEGGDPRRALLGRQIEDEPALALQAERHRRRGERQPAQGGLGGGALGAGLLEEFAPSRRGEE